MSSPTKTQIERWRKLAQQACGIPEAKTLGELAREHLGKAVQQISDLATTCPIPEVRLKASTTLVEMAKCDQDDAFGGDPEALEQLLSVALEQRRSAALQLFANGSITKRDLDTVLAVIAGDQTAKLDLLLARNQQLEKALTDATAGEGGPQIEATANRPRGVTTSIRAVK